MAEDRHDLPYEKAIEETAKTIGKAVDVVRSAESAISNVYGWMIGDRIAEARARNADAFARKTKKIIEQRKLEDKRPIPEQIAEPLLEAAQSESRDELQEIYAALSANAMDPNYQNDVRPEFIQTVRSLQPIDLIVLRKAAAFRLTQTPVFREHQMFGEIAEIRQSAVQISLTHLQQLNCIRSHSQGLVISPYGQELLVACDPHIAR